YEDDETYFGTNYALDAYGAGTFCDNDGGSTAGASSITADLSPGSYYAVVKAENGSLASMPFELSVKDENANAAIECATAIDPRIQRTLPPGDYSLVVSNDNTAGGAYNISFQDAAGSVGAAVQVACNDLNDEIVYPVEANTPYYVMVKGSTDSDVGAYGLVVESNDNSTSAMGCGADADSPDAFYRFSVTTQTTVAIDTNGSDLDTVIALYDGSATSFGTNYANDAFGDGTSCDDDSGVTPGASYLEVTLAPGDYYLVVKGKNAGFGAADQAFVVSLRDTTINGAVACSNAASGAELTQVFNPGTYTVVVSSQSAPGGNYDISFSDTASQGTTAGSLVAGGCVYGGNLSDVAVSGGKDYYVVVKGDVGSGSGNYDLDIVDNTVSDTEVTGQNGLGALACGGEVAGPIQGVYPPGDYYVVVTGDNSSQDSGSYTLYATDVGAYADNNFVACDDDSGPNGTSVIEADLQPGTHYVVVKGDGPADDGAYQLNVRDVDAHPDNRIACADGSGGERIEHDLEAGKDYTLVVKGDQAFAQGDYNVKLYDDVGLQSGSGQMLACSSNSNDIDITLPPDTYYLTVKGESTDDDDYYQLNMGELSAKKQDLVTNVPTWTETRDQIKASGAKVVSVISGGDTEAEQQAALLAQESGAVDGNGQGIWKAISGNGSGIGSGLVKAIADVANYLEMDVAIAALFQPDAGAAGFTINVVAQEPEAPALPTADGCQNKTASMHLDCQPGGAPRFEVTFENPIDDPVPANPNDDFGGYHFKLQVKGISGEGEFVLSEVPVYIIPTGNLGPPPPGAGSFEPTGVYVQDVEADACLTLIGEGFLGDGGRAAPGTCNDGLDNDGDGDVDAQDADCLGQLTQDWTDLFFKADIPVGASIEFSMCAADSLADLGSCTLNTVATVTSAGGPCTSDTQCLNVGGEDGFCADNGTCQFITPKKRESVLCGSDLQCPNQPLGAGDFTLVSYCETTTGECVYRSAPADVGSNLAAGENGKPFARMQITLNANPTGSAAPTLYDWYVTYNCRQGN
ncbi:MAG: PPC domain-containing protein, partial [Myxococcales bacterium]|nr:PPC domain-containing protein [Myxococcales bacterium]